MKKILIIIYTLLVGLFYSQNLTSSENYIYSRIYLEPVTTDNPNAKQLQTVQYFDGLGRNIQNIGIKTSPTGKDIVVPTLYEPNGKKTKTFLPLPIDSQNGGFVQGITENSVNTYYSVPNAYSEIQIEKSPLARVEKKAAPGSDWQITGNHTQRAEYQFNAAGIVKRFKASTIWNPATKLNDVSISISSDDGYTSNGYYNSNTLFKTSTFDEEQNETQTFSNAQGQDILVRQINIKPNGIVENLDTYYVYDEFNNLSFIIPPKASINAVDLNALNKLCYQYKYDKYNRVAEKKLPGKDWEFIVYDKQSRPVLSQDGNLRGTNNNFGKQGWMYVKYDSFGRIVYSGFFATTSTRMLIQDDLENLSVNAANNETKTNTPITLNGQNIYYTKEAYPKENITVLNINYYDEYPAGAPSQPAQIRNQPTLSSVPTAITSNGLNSVRNTKMMSTASYIKNIENDSWSSSVVWYDTQGRVIGTNGKNPIGGFTNTERILDFTGKATEVYTYHSKNTSNPEVTVKDRFVYTSQNYLSTHYQQINGNAEELLSELVYNDLGQITNKKVGNNLQSIDYTYNIRGWLTGINPEQMGALGNKLFSYRIKYNQVEGAENPNNSYSHLKVKPKYNGGIAEIDWKTAYGANEPGRRYGFVYDGVNRLAAGFYQLDNNPYTKEYTEVADYDMNGNITMLNRTGQIINTAAEVMDDLKYTYDGNQLTYMQETGNGNALSGYPLSAGIGQNIGYDDNGNMINHLDKGITSMSYNYLNLPSSITHSNSNQSVTYIYAANGSKVRMNKGNGESTDYLGNFQYTTNAGTPTSSVFVNEEGYFDFINSRYVYQYKDHLGNIRISYTKNAAGQASVLEENNYYPFGLKHAGYNTGDTTNNKFKYLYNGKELQGNGNLDYGWRQYMPDLGRWNGMDQLSENYASISPYGYVMNNPISLVDPDGRWIDDAGNMSNMSGNSLYLHNESYRPYLMATSNGVQRRNFLGGGGYNFTGNAAGSMYNYFLNGGSVSGLSFKNGYVKWWEGDASESGYRIGDEMYGQGNVGIMRSVKVTGDDYYLDYWGLLNNASTTQSYATNGIGLTLGTTANISNNLVSSGKMIKTSNIFKTYNLYRSNGYLNGNKYISGRKFMNNVKGINALNNSKVVKGIGQLGLFISFEQFRETHHPGYISRGIVSFGAGFVPYSGPAASLLIDNSNVNYWNIWTWGDPE